MRTARLLALLALSAAPVAFAVWYVLSATPAPQSTPAPTELGQLVTATSSATPTLSDSPPSAERLALVATSAAKTPQTVIHGRVVSAGSHAPMRGMRVSCVAVQAQQGKTEVTLKPRFTFAPLQADGGLATYACTSDIDGRFEFGGLVTGCGYTVSIVAPPGMSVTPRDVEPMEADVLFALQQLYVAHLVATEENGAPLAAADCQFLRYARVVGSGECAATEVSREPKGRARCDFTFVADCDLQRLGPFKVLLVSPGYHREDHEFWAYPVAANLGDTVLRLHLVAQETGSLSVRQECSCKEPTCAHMLEATVDVEPVNPELAWHRLTLTGLEREQRLEPISSGTYQVRVHALQGDFVYPPLAEPAAVVEIGTGETLLPIPVAGLGSVHWTLARSSSDASKGYVRISSPATLRANKPSTVLWEPFEMRGLQAGLHTFIVCARRLESVEGAEWVLSKEGGSMDDFFGVPEPYDPEWELRVMVVAGENRSVVLHGQAMAGRR